MKQNVALRVLGEILGWDDERARSEFDWLRLMSRMKYDGYRGFLAGVRFIESLADWLQQFETPAEREVAYTFVRHQLVYVSPGEMQHLVELVYSETVQRRLLAAVARQMGIPPYRVWAHPAAADHYRATLRRTLFLGLSDGARMDALRRANAGVIKNEQIAVGAQLDNQKWADLLKDLRTDAVDPSARFSFVYLLDDFVGTGKTLLRHEDGRWKGKLMKFWEQISGFRETHFEENFLLCVHHYIASFAASRAVEQRQAEVLQARGPDWFQHVAFSFGTVLPEGLPVDHQRFPEFVALMKKYYDKSVETGHTEVGGTEDMRFGFGACALPLVLEHNTPNNSVTLLWAEIPGGEGRHAMRPLFRRRQRHS